MHKRSLKPRSLRSSVKALEDVSALDATFAIAFLSFDTANRVRITEQPGLLSALVNLLDPDAVDTDSTFADEHDLVVRFALSAISQLALDKHSRVALCNERNAIKFILARACNDSREVYIRMTAMIALSNLLLEGCACDSFLENKAGVEQLVFMASTVPVIDDVKRKSSASLLLDYALNALYALTTFPQYVFVTLCACTTCAVPLPGSPLRSKSTLMRSSACLTWLREILRFTLFSSPIVSRPA